MNDLRVPIGSFFAITGAILCATGLAVDYRAALAPENVDLECGIPMLVFGAVMLWLGLRKPRASQ
jgi:hypothetical protein